MARTYELVFTDPVDTAENYEIFVGVGNKPDELPKYLVKNKKYDVVEFESESLYMARGWMAFFDPKATEAISQEDLEDENSDNPLLDMTNVVPIKPTH